VPSGRLRLDMQIKKPLSPICKRDFTLLFSAQPRN